MSTAALSLKTKNPAPKVFSFRDYRLFLKEWFQFKKENQPSYSGALFAKAAGLQSHTLLGMVIRGARGLTTSSLRSFLRALKLPAREAHYFETLVHFNQAKNPEDRHEYLQKLVTIAGKEASPVLTQVQRHSDYLRYWYLAAIRELVFLEDFETDPEWIAKRLQNRITKKQAEEGWQLLQDLELVQKNGKTWQVAHHLIDLDQEDTDLAIRNYQKSVLIRLSDALDREPREDRELSSLTLTIGENDWPKVSQKIHEFTQAINHEFSRAKPDGKEVVLLVCHMLRLTKEKS